MMRKILFSAAGVVAALALASGASATPSPNYSSELGKRFLMGDEGGAELVLPFTFTFFGSSYSAVNVSTNGYVALGQRVGAYDPDLGEDWWDPNVTNFLNGPGRIAPMWFDMDGQIYFDLSTPDQVRLTWVVEEWDVGGDFTTQLTLFKDGRITFAYDNNGSPVGHSLAGVTAGFGAADPGSSNFVNADFFSADPAIYAAYGPGAFPNGVDLTFTPGEDGYGYKVSGGSLIPIVHVPDPDPNPGAGGPVGPVGAAPEPATWLMMILGFGMVGALARRRAAGLSLAAA
jgi:hypothetical protein